MSDSTPVPPPEQRASQLPSEAEERLNAVVMRHLRKHHAYVRRIEAPDKD
jgi:predicted DNA-binding protein